MYVTLASGKGMSALNPNEDDGAIRLHRVTDISSATSFVKEI